MKPSLLLLVLPLFISACATTTGAENTEIGEIQIPQISVPVSADMADIRLSKIDLGSRNGVQYNFARDNQGRYFVIISKMDGQPLSLNTADITLIADENGNDPETISFGQENERVFTGFGAYRNSTIEYTLTIEVPGDLSGTERQLRESFTFKL